MASSASFSFDQSLWSSLTSSICALLLQAKAPSPLLLGLTLYKPPSPPSFYNTHCSNKIDSITSTIYLTKLYRSIPSNFNLLFSRFNQKAFLSTISARMGVEKTIICKGDEINFPKTGDEVTMHYIGTLENGDTYGTTFPP